MAKLDDIPTDALVQMMHAAAHREVTLQRAADREAARRKGLGRWSRITTTGEMTSPEVDEEPIDAPDAVTEDNKGVWLKMGNEG